MTDDPDTRRNRLDRLVSLAELAWYAEPEDRVRLERTIQLVSLARQAVVQARQHAEQAKVLRKEAEANFVHQTNDLASLLTELRILRDRIPK